MIIIVEDGRKEGRDGCGVIYQSSVDPWLVWIHNHFCYFRFLLSLSFERAGGVNANEVRCV